MFTLLFATQIMSCYASATHWLACFAGLAQGGISVRSKRGTVHASLSDDYMGRRCGMVRANRNDGGEIDSCHGRHVFLTFIQK